MTTLYRIPRIRHLRHSVVERLRHARHLLTFIAERATTLAATGAAKTFTLGTEAYGTQAGGTLTLTGQPADGDSIAIGSEIYTFGTGGIDISADAVATGLLTGTVQPSLDDTVTVGAKTYTFKTTLSVGPAVANEVLRGADLAASLSNLAAAINAGAGKGTLYGTGTTANAGATAVAAATTVALTAVSPNAGGNSIVTTETSTGLSFGAATLTGGNTASIEETRDNLLTALEASALVTAVANSTDAIDITTVEYLNLAYATTVDGAFGSWGAATVTGGANPTGNVAISTHGYSVGDGPFLLTTTGELPGGLETGIFYYVKTVVSSGVVRLTTSLKDMNLADITSAGSGTQTITKAASSDAVFDTMKRNHPKIVASATDIDTL